MDACTWTYAALETAVLRAAYAFRTDLCMAPGDRVLIRLDNTSGYAIAFFGAIAAGLVPVPLSPSLTAREVEFMIADAAPSAMLLDETLAHPVFSSSLAVLSMPEFAEAIENRPIADYEPTQAEDPAFLVYTSGTTGKPKGVLHAHRSAWGRRPMYRGWYGIGAADRVLHSGSLNWTYTLGAGLTDPWANGATAVVYTGEKSPRVWPDLIAAHGITIFASVPGIYRQILKYTAIDRDSVKGLRHGLSAGEALSPAVADEWQERTGTPLYEALGQTEVSTYISSGPAVPPKRCSAGKPQPGRKVVILDDEQGIEPLAAGQTGLIALDRADPGLMLGYWRRPEEEAAVFRGPWFIGGDAGSMDGAGYVSHLGRRNDLMNAGGFRVSPLEVEQELALHPSVGDVAVAEVSVRDGVSIVVAFIVLRDGHSFDEAAIGQFARTRLASYKVPKHYVAMQALPRTANGKIRRGSLTLNGIGDD